jgi:hypothetical protein
VIRHSQAKTANRVGDLTKQFRGRPNRAFFSAAWKELSKFRRPRVMIGLVGQRNLPGVAQRRAQSILRWDLRPSLWSHAFIVIPGAGRNPANFHVREVALHSPSGEFPEPADNGVTNSSLGDYDDPTVNANGALITLPLSDKEAKDIEYRAVRDPNLDRPRYDFWRALGVWQSYFWTQSASPNPLLEGFPMFSSAFVEYCFEAIQLDLAPAASEQNSAPEHLWNSAVWWTREFKQMERAIEKAFVIRDPNCAVLDPKLPSRR